MRLILLAILLSGNPFHAAAGRLISAQAPVPLPECPTLASTGNFISPGETYTDPSIPDPPVQPVFQKVQGKLLRANPQSKAKPSPHSDQPVQAINVHLLVPKVHSP